MIRKKTYLILILLLPGLAMAQSYSLVERAKIAAQVDTLLHKYLMYGSLAETGKNSPSVRVINERKGLFLPDAIIFDDINATYLDDGNGYPYKLASKSVGSYFDGLIEQFSERLVVENKRINIQYDNLDQGIVTAALERSISGTSNSGNYNLTNQDTLLIELKVLPDKSVKISKITALGSNLRVLNDLDLDGVIDSKDICKEQKGKLSLNGCPDRDNDNIPDRNDDCPDVPGSVSNHGCPASDFASKWMFSLTTGYSINRNKISQPGSAELGYDTEILDKNRSAVRIKNPGYTSALKWGADLTCFYGKSKSGIGRGIGLGFYYSRYKANYNLDGTRLVFHAFDDVTVNPEGYRRIVNLRHLEERNTFAVIQIPLQYKLRSKMNAKWAWEAGLGLTFYHISISTELVNKVIFVEGYQQYDSTSFLPYYNPAQGPSFSDVPLIQEFIAGKIGVSNPELLFMMLHERAPVYDFGSGETILEKKKVKDQTGISVRAGFKVSYFVSSRTALMAGLEGDYAPAALKLSKKESQNFNPEGKKTPDHYNPVFNSSAKTSFISLGLQLGIQIAIGKN